MIFVRTNKPGSDEYPSSHWLCQMPPLHIDSLWKTHSSDGFGITVWTVTNA